MNYSECYGYILSMPSNICKYMIIYIVLYRIYFSIGLMDPDIKGIFIRCTPMTSYLNENNAKTISDVDDVLVCTPPFFGIINLFCGLTPKLKI